MMRATGTPSLILVYHVPEYLVLDRFGKAGRACGETDEEADLEATIRIDSSVTVNAQHQFKNSIALIRLLRTER